MRVFRNSCFAGLAIALAWLGPSVAEPVRDLSQPMRATAAYAKTRLVGQWFEIARSPSRLEPDCHAVTAEVETRDDSRLTLKIDCHMGSVTGPLLEIDGILVELAPGIFGLRLVRLSQLGDMTLVVLWQADDDGLAVIGAPGGDVGWVWSKAPNVDESTIELGRAKLVEAGYSARAIMSVDHVQ